MTNPNAITSDKLARLLGRPDTPIIVDVRLPDFAEDPRLIPGVKSRDESEVAVWGPGITGRRVIVSCQSNHKLGEGAAAWLRHLGAQAESLDSRAGPPPDCRRSAPSACRRPCAGSDGLGDPGPAQDRPHRVPLADPPVRGRASGLFVPAVDALGVAERFAATPFDIEGKGLFWTHRGDRCTFDVMIEESGLTTNPLERLAAIVRGPDTARLDLAPEAARLLAASPGLSRMHSDDLPQLEAGMLLHDAFYRWARDATGETHNWPAPARTDG